MTLEEIVVEFLFLFKWSHMPSHLCWRLNQEWLITLEHVVQSHYTTCLVHFSSLFIIITNPRIRNSNIKASKAKDWVHETHITFSNPGPSSCHRSRHRALLSIWIATIFPRMSIHKLTWKPNVWFARGIWFPNLSGAMWLKSKAFEMIEQKYFGWNDGVNDQKEKIFRVGYLVPTFVCFQRPPAILALQQKIAGKYWTTELEHRISNH